jgi:hypothetical protein
VTTPGGPAPDGSYVLASTYGSDMTEASAKAIMKGNVVGSYTNVEDTFTDVMAGIPTLSALSQAFQGDVDSTFPRINLPASGSISISGSTGSDGHTHNITGSTASATAAGDPHTHGAGTLSNASNTHNHSAGTLAGSLGVPDYKPAGNGANLTELGFLKCSKDRTYTQMTFITGDAVTALGVNAFYLGVYSMNLSSGALTLVSSTGNIRSSVSNTNTEYTFNLGTAVNATKGQVYACGTLQVTSVIQTCNSLCRLSFWPISGPGSFPTTLYAYAPASSTLLSSISNASLTKNAGFVPYYALS